MDAKEKIQVESEVLQEKASAGFQAAGGETRQTEREPFGGATNSSCSAVAHGTGGLYGGHCYTVATVFLGGVEEWDAGATNPRQAKPPGGQYGCNTTCDWVCVGDGRRAAA